MKNVILLTIDALRKDALGCYGGDKQTPFIDSLQDRAIRFNNAHSPGPYTQAAFPGILTSTYYLEHGREKMLSEKRILVSEVLKKEGIATAGVHSNPYLCEYFGWNRGWDFFYDSMDADVDEKVPYTKAKALSSMAVDWLRSKKEKDKPFFLWLHYMDVHEPYVPERDYVKSVDSSIEMTDEQMLSLFKNVLLKRDVSDRRAIEFLKKLYLAHVREVDEAVEGFFSILEKADCLKDAVIIITSDHGEEFDEHGGLSHDGKMFSELVAVPLLIYDSTMEKGEVCDTLVSTIDLAPTIVNLFGLDPVEAFEGHSLVPLEEYTADGIFGESFDKHGNHEPGREKEIYYHQRDYLKIIYRKTDDSWQLYDLKEDPGELKNIIDSSPYAQQMEQKLILRINRHRDSFSTKKTIDQETEVLDKKRVKELEEKIEKAKEIFKQAFDRFNVENTRLIWSGGKDSTLTLWICRQYCLVNNVKLPKAFTVDEGDAFREIDEFLKKQSKAWGVELDWGRNEDVLRAAGYELNADVNVKDLNERNRAEIKRIGFDLERFPFEAESYVGNHLMKTVVFNTYLEDNNVKAVFQGLRWDEQPARKNDSHLEDVAADELTPPHSRYRPILHFTERDVWDTIFQYNIPYCSLYKLGYRSLGARTTSLKSSDIPAWEQDLENTEERAGRRQDKEKTMERLRKLGYM